MHELKRSNGALLHARSSRVFSHHTSFEANSYQTFRANAEGWSKVLSTELKNAGSPKDLFIGLSFETMLYAETVVKSKGGDKSTSTANAEINMKVYVDG